MSEQLPVSAIQRLVSKPAGPLGFGTGFLHHVGDRGEAVRLLRQAFDAGITYFDTARLYGEGICEGLLGEAFAGQRDRIVIATKVGILPPGRDLAKRAVGKAASLARKIGPLRAVVPEPAIRYPMFGVFDVPRMRTSFETSLRELKTDHVDLLLLHECTAADVANSDVTGFLDTLVQEGKVRAWGVAPRDVDMIEIDRSGTAYGDVTQFADAIRGEVPAQSAPALVVTHSCLGSSFQETLSRLKTDSGLAARWGEAVGMDVSDPAALAKLFLARAMQRNPDGVVLFSTTRADRLGPNLEAVGLLASLDVVSAFSGLLEAV
ncbi:MAG: aldo/keto reductase [Hyphomonas sp.]|nr:aldo/keto reductase [Hyphomonas sp.]